MSYFFPPLTHIYMQAKEQTMYCICLQIEVAVRDAKRIPAESGNIIALRQEKKPTQTSGFQIHSCSTDFSIFTSTRIPGFLVDLLNGMVLIHFIIHLIEH